MAPALNVCFGSVGRAARRLARPRWLGLAALAALTFLIAGDSTRAQSALGIGIDPLGVLDLQVKANAVVVLDSSGSMKEVPSVSLQTGISNGELVGDDPNAKMALAKGVLSTIIQQNQAKVKFRFGQYTQPQANVTLDNQDRFYYATTLADNPGWTATNLNNVQINSGGNGATAPGISRNSANDTLIINGTTYYYLTAGKWWNGATIRTNGTVVTTGTKTNPAKVWLRTDTNNTVCTAASSVCVPFTFKGAYFTRGGGTCGGFQELHALAPCSLIDQFDGANGIGKNLQPELLINANGDIDGYVDGTLGGNPASAPTWNGIRASGSTPISASLTDIKTWFQGTLWPTITAPKPRTFVVFVTDGDDQCITGTSPYDVDALTAAYRAQQLYARVSPTEATSSVTTYVVLFGNDTGAINHANWIAWGGSGLTGIPTTGTGASTRWSRAPTAAEVSACKAAGGCTDAFTAQNADDLSNFIQDAIDQGSASGQFAAAPTQTESIWEYGADVTVDPLDPDTRYNAFVPVVFQPVFDAANYAGTFTAWAGVPAVAKWEASAKLATRVNISTPSMFSQLHGGATPATIGSSSALIKRRIFTTSGNGVFTDTTSRTPVPLWPPTTSGTGAIAPTTDTTPGGVDVALGIVGTGDAAEFTNLQTQYGACLGTPLPANCTSAIVATKVARARREAREMILAFTAGAVPAKDANGYPSRVASGGNAGELLYQGRTGLIAETTLGTPAVITAPLEIPSNAHNPEYRLYRDGPRNGSSAVNGVDLGFGLRNPDKDGTPASKANNNLKPVMSVVYLPTNQMLHAFRAGPCIAACADTGGEELWGFVPFDELGKLNQRMKPQKRDPHTYALDAPLRFADVYVPEAFNQSVGGVTVSLPGVWRTLLFFGRGIGGKSLTALDVTVPGPATRAAMGATAINPPLVMWSRGNPDTRDGTSGGTPNNTAADKTAYARMGQTWSVPAVVKVNASDNPTTRKPTGVEYVAYLGSGYSDVSTEGTTFYALDALTGDVVSSFDVGDRTSGAIFPNNAIVAPPAAMTPDIYSFTTYIHPSDAVATSVYVGDIHGRLWRFPAKGAGITASSQTAAPTANAGGLFADFGANQPIANGVSLLYYNSDNTGDKPHVYVETGNDSRVTPPGDTPPFQTTPPFKMWGLRDEDLTSDPDSSDGVNGPARVLFTETFPNNPPPGYRGTTQPATAFNVARQGRVFFAGTQFTPAGTECVSSLDSVLFALTGVLGDAAYDLNATGQDKYIQLNDQVINDIQIVRQSPSSSQVNVSQGVGAAGSPPPKPKVPPVKNTPPPARGDVYPSDVRVSSPVCR